MEFVCANRNFVVFLFILANGLLIQREVVKQKAKATEVNPIKVR